MTKYVFTAQMDIPPHLEAEFNRIYDAEHIPNIVKVPGVLGCRRYTVHEAMVPGIPKFIAIYDLASPDVMKQPEWRAASDRGEWKPKIRPHTFNRIHCVYRTLT